MKKFVSLTLALCLVLTLFTACGANSAAPQYAMKEEAMEAPMAMDMAAGNSLTTAGAGQSQAIPENRKWIITVNMAAETEDLETLLASLDKKIAGLNGYVEDQNIYNGSSYSSRRYRSASMTVRIPADSVDQFTQDVSGISNVVRSNKNLEDITLTYTATESRVKALQTEEARLLELMAMAKNMEDLLLIEKRLTEVRTELEQVTSQLRLYDNLIDFGTIHLNLQQVTKFTDTTQEPTVWQRIGSGFLESLEGIGDFFVEIFVWIVVASPYLAILAVIVIVTVLLVKKASKKHKKASNDPQ